MAESRRHVREESSIPQPNAWLVVMGAMVQSRGWTIQLGCTTSEHCAINAGDALALVDEQNGEPIVVAFGRVYRVRSMPDGVALYMDSVVRMETPAPVPSLVGILGPSTSGISRWDWSSFSDMLKNLAGLEFAKMPVLKGDTADEQSYIRELLQLAVVDDLLGPADGPFEKIVGMSVRDRYLVGKLAPRDTGIDEDQNEGLVGGSGDVNPEETGREVDVSTNQSLVPSSLGLTFCVDGVAEGIELHVNWGRYERAEHEQAEEESGRTIRAWKRIPSGGSTTISLSDRSIQPTAVDPDCPAVVIQGSISEPRENGDRIVTIFLVNDQEVSGSNQDQAWVFQPELLVRDPGNRAVFQRRPVMDIGGADSERESLEMVYRRRVEFAVGHGISVHAKTVEGDEEHAMEIRTSVIPQHEVPVTETPGVEAEDRSALHSLVENGYLDMKRLAEMDQSELVSVLGILTEDYGRWIEEQESRVGADVLGYDDVANDAVDKCRQILARLREGVDVLSSDDRALDAFRFASFTMASQRVHSIYALQRRRGEKPDFDCLDVPKNRSWRPFQLAFMLLSIPSLSNPKHRDRTEAIEAYADLLWFPTGGGKTEAYLGVAAFTMAIRRLQHGFGNLDSGRGLSVIMRYTLRLLTLQQFQRATTLLCAMEVLRRDDARKWGNEPFTIGLWVGQRVTPNSTKESHEAIENERDGKRGTGSTPAQLTSCPWCGSEIAPGRDVEVDLDIGRTLIYCGDKYGRCDFSRAKSRGLGLPVSVVDEEIYRRPPSMMIATVDKFAMMAWRGQVRTLFGRATQECERHGLLWPEADCTGNHPKKGSLPATTVKQIKHMRPPDLIIQDEFHLISGPLGTMVGLYETAVDALSTWVMDDVEIRPKIIASTATVRKAEEQVDNVFLRRVAVFPPHGLDIEDNFFSVQRPVDKKPGRRYMGICSPGSSRPAVLIRVYVALLTAARELFERFGQAADPYMTLIGYFNSLRELGGMRRLAEDDVQTRSYRVQMSKVSRPGLAQRSVRTIDELTSRVSSKDIPKKLDQLEVRYRSSWEKGETRAVDIMLATNMLSVGVDIDRLGLMVVNGQPKTTAEYIQSTSRVGRSFPGLVCTVLTWARPRDLSHYETFEHYHATFYKHVEAQSVTPFAPRALDRGLTGVMVSLLRLDHDNLNPNLGAESLDDSGMTEATEVKDEVSDRAWKIKDKAARQNAEIMAADRIDRWVKEASRPGRKLGYETERRQGDVVGLLRKPGSMVWDEFTVPMSMREVEPGVQLVMDMSKLRNAPAWRRKANTGDKDGGKS